mgnify:CR=1 FL=1
MTCLARMNGDVSAPSSTLENGGSEVQKWGVKVQWRQWWWFCLVYLRDTNDVIMRGLFQLQSTPGSKTHFFLHFIFLEKEKIFDLCSYLLPPGHSTINIQHMHTPATTWDGRQAAEGIHQPWHSCYGHQQTINCVEPLGEAGEGCPWCWCTDGRHWEGTYEHSSGLVLTNACSGQAQWRPTSSSWLHNAQQSMPETNTCRPNSIRCRQPRARRPVHVHLRCLERIPLRSSAQGRCGYFYVSYSMGKIQILDGASRMELFRWWIYT